jgi:NADH dehydrogenase FAD-containing subunit
VNPASTYYSLDIQYAYQGTCEDIQKSEKTITILATAKATIDSVIAALGIGDKVHATDLYDGTANNTASYPTESLEERVQDLEDAADGNP